MEQFKNAFKKPEEGRRADAPRRVTRDVKQQKEQRNLPPTPNVESLQLGDAGSRPHATFNRGEGPSSLGASFYEEMEGEEQYQHPPAEQFGTSLLQ